MSDSTPPPDAADSTPKHEATDFADRMKGFGEELQSRGEQLGREAQSAGDRWSKDPSLNRTATTATRAWGLIVLAVGLWFLADVTLGYDLPTIPWRDLWPALLIVVGLLVIARGTTRRRA